VVELVETKQESCIFSTKCRGENIKLIVIPTKAGILQIETKLK